MALIDPRPPDSYPGPLLRTAGDYAWRLLVLGTVVYFAVKLLAHLYLAVIPFIVALLVTALLRPILGFFLRRGHVARALSTLATILAAGRSARRASSALVVIRAAERGPAAR